MRVVRFPFLLFACGLLPLSTRLVSASEALPIVAVTASAHHATHVPAHVLDGDLTTRWSAEGNEQWLQVDLGSTRTVGSIELAFPGGGRRHALFVLEASLDGATWQTVFEGQSSGATEQLECIRIPTTRARFVRYVGFGNSDNAWNSLSELRIRRAEAME